jgi:beta-1,4-mannosyltransferase
MRVVAKPAFSNRRMNPYTSLLYEHIRPLVDEIVEYPTRQFLSGKIDIVHVHWPDHVVASPKLLRAAKRTTGFLVRMIEHKARGARVIWTAHNVVPHTVRHPLVAAGFWRIFLRLIDGVVFLSALSRNETLTAHPRIRHLPYAIIPHGHYKALIPRNIGRTRARDRLGLPANKFIFLHFGLVRDYKNVLLLIKEFLSLERPDGYLVIAGRISGNDALRAAIQHLASERDNIRLDLKFIPDETLHTYLAACDFVVLPYKRILNSGSVLYALSAGRPVIVPKIGSIPEIAAQVGRAWVRTYSGGFDKCYLMEAMEHPLPPTSLPDLSFYDWNVIAKQTVDFYRRVISRGER